MVDQDLLKGVVPIVATVLVALLSVPSLQVPLSKVKLRGSHVLVDEQYQDKDGIATEDSIKAFSDCRPRIAVWLSLTLGLAASIASRVLALEQHVQSWHYELSLSLSWHGLLSWILLCFQGTCLPYRHQYQLKFRLAVCGVLSSLTIAIAISARDLFPAIAALVNPDVSARVSGILCLAQFAAALAAACSFAGFPRRPDVFQKGIMVDQQYTVSLLDLFTFSWNRVVFDTAKERQMKISDIPAPDHKTRSHNLQEDFLAKSGKGRLWRRLIKAYSYELVLQWILTFIIAFLALFPQLVLFNFLGRIESRGDSPTTDPHLFVWAFGLLLSQLLQVGVGNWLRWITCCRLEIPVISLLQSLVFSKALKQFETVSPGQKDEKKDDGEQADAQGKGLPAGKDKEKEAKQSIINHMKLDSTRVTIFCVYNNNFPLAFYKLVLAGSFLMRLLGWKAVLAGIGSACFMVPFSFWFSRKYAKLHFNLMKYRDRKAHLLTEALQGMRQIKYSALEQHWENKVLTSRREELNQYWKVSLWQCVLIFLVNLGPLLLACVSFSVYAWENGTHIKASVIFTSLGLFDQLDEAIALVPVLQMYMVEAWTSCVRLEKYFSQPDKEPFTEPGDNISLDKATVIWPSVEDKKDDLLASQEMQSMLRDISLEFPAAKLSVITGKTGSGKSLLLAAILGEVKLLSGKVRTPTTPPMEEPAPEYIPPSDWVIPSVTSFVSQTPWIESGTVKENIIFGLPFDEVRYRKVLHACALGRDVELLVDGDQTEVGPKGVTLSGGQRWRVALARALYSRAGILILDDVLSAVDAHVGRLIVDEALNGDLAKGRTRILATHHAELVMPHASYLVKLHEGRLDLAETITHPESSTFEPMDDETEVGSTVISDEATEVNDVAVSAHGKALDEEVPAKPKAMRTKKDDSSNEEKRETGRVKWKVYKAYYKASGSAFFWIFGISILVLDRLMGVSRTWALKELAERASATASAHLAHLFHLSSSQVYFTKAEDLTDGAAEGQIAFWMVVYVLLYFAGNIGMVVRVLAVMIVGLRASRTLFQRMTHAILRAPLRWIDTIPSGRILNRFTSDTFSVDRRLAGETFGFIQSCFSLVVIIGTSLSVSVYVIFFGLALLLLYTRIANQYIHAAREIKRINSVSHSPIYDQFSSVLSGLSTIRAFGRTDFYMNRMHNLIDNSSKATWALQLCTRWMAYRMGMLGALFVSVVATAVAVGGVNAALAGFSLTFALRYTGALTVLLQSMTSVELGFNAAERMLEYAEIETEPEGGNDAPAAWPTGGQIEMDHVTVSYAEDLPDVLKDLSFTIKAGERVGVVGRTGAGKSTLAAVLFRLLEPKQGAVRIDNIDISTLKLDQLRSRLAIIPQDPFLFSGTLRSNLDMEGNLEDYDLHAALQRVHLVEPPAADPDRPSAYPPVVDQPVGDDGVAPSNSSSKTTSSSSTNIFTNLSYPISTGGLNLSQGQRQLCCLARALLSRPKIVVLDEATSAVDRATDAAIQASLRREFAATGCTVLVVAHRLSTVADFDRLLVLEGGRVAEIGTPAELLRNGIEREERERKAEKAAASVKALEVVAHTPEGPVTEEEYVPEPEPVYEGTGAFWELVKKSAEKEKLIKMILGEDGQIASFSSSSASSALHLHR